MTEKDDLRQAMNKFIAGIPSKGFLVHTDRATTQADWDALDPNSYETTCAKCDATIIGQFGPDHHEMITPCAECGSTETKGCVSSPAGATHLAMWDSVFWD